MFILATSLSSFSLQPFFIPLIILFAAIGGWLVGQAFFSEPISRKNHKHKKLVIRCFIGLICLWLSGIALIYFYVLQPKPEVIDEYLEEENGEQPSFSELPDISMNIYLNGEQLI